MTTLPATLTPPASQTLLPATLPGSHATPHAPITSAQLNADVNDAFRTAFSQIARVALPFMADNAYFSDLLYDAANAARMPTDGTMYLLVRHAGTNIYSDPLDAARECQTCYDGRAVLRIKRGRYNACFVETVYTRANGFVV